ncbi:MAG: hypothetical protein MR357_01300 [Anaeroplasma sp.]|nr:hypothetical protein [Anaeroplasma sp.]
MIFVTVGTHEQSFDRLIKKIDEIKEKALIEDEIVIQKGYSKYEPKNCKYYDLIPWEQMQELYKNARIIICHGGPASFIDALSLGKKPIIVPRQFKYNEHVNNHQVDFCLELKKRGLNIEVIIDINELEGAILNYDNDSLEFKSNNANFNNMLIEDVKKLFD